MSRYIHRAEHTKYKPKSEAHRQVPVKRLGNCAAESGWCTDGEAGVSGVTADQGDDFRGFDSEWPLLLIRYLAIMLKYEWNNLKFIQCTIYVDAFRKLYHSYSTAHG